VSLLRGKKTTIILSSIPSCDIARRVTSREREAAPLAASVEPFIKFKHLDVRHPSRHRPEVSHRSWQNIASVATTVDCDQAHVGHSNFMVRQGVADKAFSVTGSSAWKASCDIKQSTRVKTFWNLGLDFSLHNLGMIGVVDCQIISLTGIVLYKKQKHNMADRPAFSSRADKITT